MKIGLSGAQSVGKTTLLNAIRSEEIFKNFDVCNEITRKIKGYGISINEDGTDVTQRLVMQEHLVNVIMHDNLITDRTSLDGFVYTTWLFDRGNVSLDTYNFALKVFKRVQPYYDYQFYIEPEFDIENDGVRSINLDFRDQIVDIFNHVIQFKKVEVIRIHGSVRNRVTQILENVERLK